MFSANVATYSPRAQGRFRRNGRNSVLLTARQTRNARRRRGSLGTYAQITRSPERILPTVVVNLPAPVLCPRCLQNTGIMQYWDMGVRKCDQWKDGSGYCNTEFMVKHVVTKAAAVAAPVAVSVPAGRSGGLRRPIWPLR